MKRTSKKFVFVVVLFALLFALVGCTKKGKQNPNVENPTSVYVSIAENGKTYSVTKEKVYNELKAANGVSSLVDLMAEQLLADYVNKVTDEEVVKAIDKDVYGEEELSVEEKDEKATAFLKSTFEKYGIRTDDVHAEAIKKIYKLTLAKKAYASEKLEEEIKAHNEAYQQWVDNGSDEEEENAVTSPYFTESEYATYYASNNEDKYWTIIVPFASNREVKIALNQRGIDNSNGKWTKAGAELTKAQVIAEFVELYKTVNASSLTSDANLDTNKLDETSEFYYTAADLNKVSSSLIKLLDDFYTEENYYSANAIALNSGALHALVLDLKSELIVEYEDLEEAKQNEVIAEAEKALKEADVTASYINNKMYELFADKGLVIYDTVISNSYATTVGTNAKYEKTDKESKTVVAEVDGKEITAEQLFKAMDKVSGITIALSELTYQRFLNNTEINKFYNVETKEWLDSKVKANIEDQIKTEKENFKNGTYKEYGYDPKEMSFDDFINVVYSAKSEDDLVLLFLYSTVVKEYTNSLLDVAVLENKEYVDSKVWPLIEAKMTEALDEYFSVKGIHLLVCAYANTLDYISGGEIVDPAEWTENQKELASKLVAEVKKFVEASTGTYSARLKKVQEAFDACPVTGGEGVNTTVTSTDGTVTIDVLPYKQAGLYAKFEDLGSFKNGSMVKPFNDAVKAIYDQDIADDKKDRTTVSEEIVTEFGYHLYINLASNEKTSYTVKVDDVDKKFTLPRLEDVRSYIKDDDNVSSTVKTLITSYYTPVANEISGQYLTYVLQYVALQDNISTLNITSTNYDLEDVKYAMNNSIDAWFETNLKYITKEDLVKFK